MKNINMKNVPVYDRTNVVYKWLNNMIKSYNFGKQSLILSDEIGGSVSCLSNCHDMAIHISHVDALIPYIGIENFKRDARTDSDYPVELYFYYKGFRFFSIYTWSGYNKSVVDLYGENIELVGETT